jgi:uncharacterized protein (DUF2147 family)
LKATGNGRTATSSPSRNAAPRIAPRSRQSAGSMAGKDGSYRGTLTDLEAKKTYKGKAKIVGNSASMAGCVLGGLICKTEVWVKQ